MSMFEVLNLAHLLVFFPASSLCFMLSSVSCRAMRSINVEQQALPSIKAPLPLSTSLSSHVSSARVSSSCAYELSQLVPCPLSCGFLIPCPPSCACDLQALSLGPSSRSTMRGLLNNHEGADIFATKSPQICSNPISRGKGTHLSFLTVARQETKHR